MRSILRELDEALRGKKIEPALLKQGTGHIRIGPLIIGIVGLGAVYGLFMGLYAVLGKPIPCPAQLAASTVKVPALFLLTLFVTYPSLYVFSALFGVKLGPLDILKIILIPITVNMAVLASLGPITGFFTLNTDSYAFMKILNVGFFALSGFIGIGVLMKILENIEKAPAVDEAQTSPESGPSGSDVGEAAPKAGRRRGAVEEDSPAKNTFHVWIVLYAVVGAQMGWILRPFIGAPDLPFELFRDREANIFTDVIRTLGELF